MNTKKVLTELKEKYPGKNVVINTPDEPTEIICEIDPGEERSRAIAVVDYIRPHYHRNSKEVYTILRGELDLHFRDEVLTLKEGDEVEIEPRRVHWAFGNETWFEVVSEPGWTPEDHILAIDYQEISRKEYDKRF